MSRKKKAPKPVEVPSEPNWWVTMPSADFKAKIKAMSYDQCQALRLLIQEQVRRTTLRPYLEDLTPEEQKAAGRLAPIHRGRHEAVLSRIHQEPLVNRPPSDL